MSPFLRQLPVLAAWLLAAGPPASLAAKPNVLFLVSDDLTAEALGCYGNPQCVTPNIDRLAARGVRFERAYCQFPVCGPARAALMSGLYPQQNGVTGNGSAGSLEARLRGRATMPEHFGRNGWHTARVSKIYHMAVPGDITAGVDGADHAPSWHEKFNCKAPEWMSEGVHEHLSNERLNKDPEKHYGLGFGTAFYTVRVGGEGAQQADVQAAGKAAEQLAVKRDGPFFLAVGFVRPHVPLVAPEAFFDLHPGDRVKLPERVGNDWDDIPRAGISTYNSKARGLTDEATRRKVIAAYRAAVSFMDAQVGLVLDALQARGLADDTIVVFTSDHGYHLGEHDFWQKMSLHEESVRVPLIIAAPGLKPAVVRGIAEHVDLFPTLATLAGLPVPEHLPGKSLVPLFDAPDEVGSSAYCLRGTSHLLRTPRWAYMRHRDGSRELYDMEDDPRQFTNLAEDPKHRDVLLRLDAALDVRLKQAVDAAR